MSANLVDLEPVARLVVATLAAAPAAVVAGSLEITVGTGAAGTRDGQPGSAAVTLGTPFDLASLTKPIVALTTARLARAGLLSLTELLGDVLPAARNTPAGEASLEFLLSHRSGLEAHVRLFEPLVTGGEIDRTEAVVTAARSRRAECAGAPPAEGFPPVYSDMGYLLLGKAIEARTGEPLDETVAREVLAPLGLVGRMGSSRQLRELAPDFARVVAATENVPFRGGVVSGVVHDENAWAIAGEAMCGHAGLFGDAESMLAVGRAVLTALHTDLGWLGPADLAPLVRTRPGGSHLAGFDRKSGDAPSAGSRLGPSTFGHLGFTGTSIWIDPDARFVGVLLTNRVHPTRAHVAIRAARPAAYDAMFDALSSEADKLAR